jgi:hypothetical protein
MFGLILSQITAANGYQTNLGQRVVFGAPPDASEYDKDAIYFYPVSKQISQENQRWEHRQIWEIVAVRFSPQADIAISQVECDVWKAIGLDVTLNDVIISPAEGAVEYDIQTAGKQAVMVTFRVEAMSRTRLFETP